ncbi:MAG: Gfo/Idh/MocA family oxidoreductase [Chloroflexi bacterium]|nr:Gfo/Idh/MocA family oxidoreductase [Chloroflexota bacterium]
MNSPIDMVVCGGGNRAYRAYGPLAQRYPDQLRFIAIAEPDEARRKRFALAHNIPPERQFKSWEEMLSRPQMAPTLLNTTMDQMHVSSTLAALEVGYHVLLEKPMAVTPQDCINLVQTAQRTGSILQICHVMRYAPFFRTIYDVVQSGRLGDMVIFDHHENLAYWHMAHSFVRGNWRNKETSGPMILTKCCHDLDYLRWMIGSTVSWLSSTGHINAFRPDRVGPEIPDRCTDGCPIAESCIYYAPRLYLEASDDSFIVTAMTVDPSPASRLEALQTGPYGRCVYRCDNDVVDHQIVTMVFENGVTANLTMQGHTQVEGRTMRYHGTRGSLYADQPKNEIVIYDHRTAQGEIIHPGPATSGHGGGDYGVMHAFLQAVQDPSAEVLTSAQASLDSHLMAFAAEQARETALPIDFRYYQQVLG